MSKRLQQKILGTIFLLAFSRFGNYIPLPNIDHKAAYQSIASNSIANLLNVFSGGGVASIGIFVLGIIPYINASILMQLVTNVIPSLEKLQKEEGEIGRKKIARITRYLTLVLSIIQGVGLSLWLRPFVFGWGNEFIIGTTLTVTAGALINMWTAEKITEKGLGNGSSLLIYTNILAGSPKLVHQQLIHNKTLADLPEIILILTIVLVTITGIIFIQEGTKKIPILSARQLGTGQTETKTSYLPLRLNQGGVMPLIFASTFLSIPAYLSQLTSNTVLLRIFSALSPNGQNKTIYLMCYFLLILLFSYFYTSLVTNCEEISKNLKKMEFSIPGIRPGKATTVYLQKTLNRLTFFGASFLACVTIIPIIIESTLGLTTFKGLGANSLLILVGVAIDTSRQIQTYIISKNYEDMID
jgi:preprotein translocase subunit SecY